MKIALTGTQSVGKTTLIKALAKLPQFKDYHIATERSKYLRDLGIPLNTNSTYLGQTIFAAERASELIRPEGLLTDRTIIDVMAFTNLSTDSSLDYLIKKDLINAWLPMTLQYDYLFYVSPEGVEIEDNGVRETNSEYRDKIDKEIRMILSEKEIPYFEIYGTTEERIQQILDTVYLS